MSVIYRILNVVTDHFYIGSAGKPKRRKWEHWSELKKGVHHCHALQAAWTLYGEDAFEFEIIEVVAEADKFLIEDTHLLQHAGSPECYNTAMSSQVPPAVTAETALKIQKSMRLLYADKANHPRTGKLHTPESKAKISASRTGKQAGAAHYRYGQTVSPEVRAKIGDTQRGVAKAPRVYTPDGLEQARENMKRNAAVNVVKSFGNVLSKLPVEIQERYDFSNAVYAGALIRITGIVCKQHGVFTQYSAQLRKGSGCPHCGIGIRAAAKSAQMLDAWGDADKRAKMLAARKKVAP
jgi:group I intron endonuclease